MIQNRSEKKRQTHKHQTDLSRARGRLDPVSRHFKRCNRSKKPSKEGPESSSKILLTSRLMGTSGFLGRWHSPQIAPAAQKLFLGKCAPVAELVDEWVTLKPSLRVEEMYL